MDDVDAIPSISSGTVGSRFVSQNEIETAQAKRDEQWKAAYARLGQEPPPRPTEDVFDGRSLAEKLAANRAAKQEEWEEKNKLGNQFRALEEDEVLFLDSVWEKQREEERQRKEQDGQEVKGFKEAVAARESAANKPPLLASQTSISSITKSPAVPPAKKDLKKSLKGVVVKKKKPPVKSASTGTSADKAQSTAKTDEASKPTHPPKDDAADVVEERQSKRRRVSESNS